MQRRTNLTHLILASVTVLGLTFLMVAIDVQARIAFMSDRDWNWEIYVMDNHGGNQRNLTNNPADDRAPSWSPDGKQISFVWDRQIYVMDTDGRNSRNITNHPEDERAPAQYNAVLSDSIDMLLLWSEGF